MSRHGVQQDDRKVDPWEELVRREREDGVGPREKPYTTHATPMAKWVRTPTTIGPSIVPRTDVTPLTSWENRWKRM